MSDLLDDPRLDPFRQLTQAKGADHMVIEGEFAVSRMLRSQPHRCRVIVATPSVAQRLTALTESTTIVRLEAATLRELCGFDFHRGCLASLSRPALETHPIAPKAVVAVGICDPRNLGAIIRNAKAFAASGLWLGPGCGDPYSRQASRASMGLNLSLAIHQAPELDLALQELERAKITSIAAALGPDCEPLSQLRLSGDWALLVGNEGHGLSPDIVRRCEKRVYIPMAEGVDSINVATATGILLHSLAAMR